MAISDNGYPMYFVPDVKINENDLRVIAADDIQKIKVTEKLEKDLSYCNLTLESLEGLYYDRAGNIIIKDGDEFYMFRLKIDTLKHKRIDSRSDVQQKIEKRLLEQLKEELNIYNFDENPTITLTNGKTTIEPDFYSGEKRIIGEIHTHLGKLKGAQPDKIANDILKMILFEKDKKIEFQKIIVVCDEEEYKQLQGNSFVAESIRLFGINLYCFELNEHEKKELQEAINKQDLLR